MNRKKGGMRAIWGVIMGGALVVGGLGWLAVHLRSEPQPRAHVTAPPSPQPSSPPANGACADCHPGPLRLWSGSDHDLALQSAGKSTVYGDFDEVNFEHLGRATEFFRRREEHWVRTEGAQGTLGEFRVAYSEGVRPLQQYLVQGAAGRLQVLPFGWDTRPAQAGGGRWFALDPHGKIPPGDPLHWTGPMFAWNTMCAECHSTELDKRYDADTDTFHTTWKHLDVTCEACHGRGDDHLAWAANQGGAKPADSYPGRGLAPGLHQTARRWQLLPGQRLASPTGPSASDAVLGMCARCHARRTGIRAAASVPGPLLRDYVPSLLVDPLYFPDGQVRDEVYEWGSFLQSKMHAAGVTCADCHDPHSLEVQGDDAAPVCLRCHEREYYGSPQHHFHKSDGPGASCVGCHMPERVYMIVDGRRDHSLRVPRPDLTVKLGTPNACAGCHRDRTARWADAAVQGWYPDGRWREPHFGEAFAKADAGDPSAVSGLISVIERPGPAIVRGSAVQRLQAFLGSDGRALPVVARAALDPDPLVRLGAAIGLSGLGPESIARGGAALDGLCRDPIAAVAVEAGRSAATIRGLWPSEQRTRFDSAIERTLAAEKVHGELPRGQYNEAGLLSALERWPLAEAAYRLALAGDPTLVPAMLDLADLLRATDRDSEAESWLRRATTYNTEQSDARIALGLWLVRNGRKRDAMLVFAQAVGGKPVDARAAYIYGIALEESGDATSALRVWEQGLTAHPFDRDLPLALIETYRKQGRAAQAEATLKRLRARYPHDTGLASPDAQ